jgi:hypothetical protein
MKKQIGIFLFQVGCFDNCDPGLLEVHLLQKIDRCDEIFVLIGIQILKFVFEISIDCNEEE